MERAVLVLAAAAFAVSGVATATTSSSSVATSTANHRHVQLTGARMKAASYTVVAGRITGLTVELKGHAAVGAVATARYGTDAAIPCVVGLYDVVNDQTPVTCTGFAEPAARPRDLLVAVT